MALTKFNPQSYQDNVAAYLASMGINVAPAQQYQTPITAQAPGIGSPTEIGKNLAINQAKKYAYNKGAEALGLTGASTGATIGTTAAGPTVGAATGVGYGAPTVGSGVTGMAGVDTVVPAATNIAATSGSIGAGPIAAIIAGTYLTGQSAYNQLQGKEDKTPTGKYGRSQLAYTTGGLSEVARPLGIDFNTDKWKGEQDRRKKLAEAGITGWDRLNAATPRLTKGRSLAELINPNYAQDFRGLTKDAGFVNNKFAKSRNEGDLAPEDIWGYSAFGEKYGNDWLGKFSEAQRKGIAQTALDAGAVKEGKGSVSIDFNADLDKKIQEFLKPKAAPKKK